MYRVNNPGSCGIQASTPRPRGERNRNINCKGSAVPWRKTMAWWFMVSLISWEIWQFCSLTIVISYRHLNFEGLVITKFICRYGYWGICFLYATFFVLGGLVSVGKSYNNSEAVRKGVHFFLSTQNDEGGWGECLESCPSMVIEWSLNCSTIFNRAIIILKLAFDMYMLDYFGTEIHTFRREPNKFGTNIMGYAWSNVRWPGLYRGA